MTSSLSAVPSFIMAVTALTFAAKASSSASNLRGRGASGDLRLVMPPIPTAFSPLPPHSEGRMRSYCFVKGEQCKEYWFLLCGAGMRANLESLGLETRAKFSRVAAKSLRCPGSVLPKCSLSDKAIACPSVI